MPKGKKGFQKGEFVAGRGRPKSLKTVISTQAKVLRNEIVNQEKDSKIIAQKIATDMITKKIAPLIRAGMIPAMGQHFVFKIVEDKNDKGTIISRKHVQVTDADEIALALDQIEDGGTDPNGVYYYITAKEPDHKAVEMLLNRALGKPKESLELSGEVEFSLSGIAQKAKQLREQKMKEIEGSQVNAPPVA